MWVKLHELRRDLKKHFDFTFRMDLSKIHQHVKSYADVRVNAQGQYDDGLYIFDGKIDTVLHLVCAKCLTVFEWPINLSWHDVFSREAEPSEVNDKEEEIHYVKQDKLDLQPFIQEAIILAIPFVPVCREDCKGLCPSCGVDQNKHNCNCKTEQIDPRLAELKNFKF